MCDYYSISQIRCYRACKQKWAYRYKEKLQSKKPARPLYMGSTIHKLLEVRAKGGNWKECLQNEIIPEFWKMPDTYKAELGYDFEDACYKIMDQYDWVYRNEKLNYLETEFKIDYKIYGKRHLIGYVDAIVEFNGEQFIVEHKTFKDAKMPYENTWLNSQTAVYIKALNSMGYNIKGVIWDMIKSVPPKAPKVLKNGNLGKQYGTQTLHSFYWDGWSKENIPKEIYDQVKDNYSNFLDRYIVYMPEKIVDNIFKDFKSTMYDIRHNDNCSKNLSRDCSWCQFSDLCKTELTGGDVESVKNLLFTRR